MDDPTDLDALVSELNASPARSSSDPRLEMWLEVLADRRATDLFLVSGDCPAIRVDGRLERLGGAPLGGDEIEEMVLAAMPEHAQQRYTAQRVTDFSLARPPHGRFRVNLHRERGRPAAAVRALPVRIPELSALNLPKAVERLAHIPHGLVLIGGATGSGKTTTLAALVGDINRHQAKHIITVEDPIEYDHANLSGLVEQIEIGSDAPDFPTALRAAVRQAPDVIVIGEMRDPETMRIALAAAETGHLVFSTLHTTGTASTIARISDSFPAERQPTIRQELAMALSAVFTQTLLPHTAGGRIPACELLLMSYGARHHIRLNAMQHLHQEITITRKLGSFSLEESLAQLVGSGSVKREDALLRANHLDEIKDLLSIHVPGSS